MKSPKYQLLIKTNSYAGNFELDLLAYVFGYLIENGHDWTKKFYELAYKEMGEKFIDNLSEKYHHYFDEYGPTIGEITGKGATDFVVYFDKKLNKKDLSIITNRIYKFPYGLAKSWEFAPKDVKIKDIIFGEFEN